MPSSTSPLLSVYFPVLSLLPMPHPRLILRSNFIPQQHLSPGAALPAPVTGSGEHEPAGRVDVYGAEDSPAMAGDDGKGDGGPIAIRRRRGEVVDAEDILACAVETSVQILR